MYEYSKEKHKLFTEEGQVLFLKIRDQTQGLLALAGAVRLDKVINNNTGDTWLMIACMDRQVELGEIVEINQPHIAGQNRIFVKSNRT